MSAFPPDFFRSFTLRICGSLDIHKALRDAFAYLQDFVPVDVLGLGFNNFESACIEVVAHVARDGHSVPWVGGLQGIPITAAMVQYIQSLPTNRPMVRVFNQPGTVPAPLRAGFPGMKTHSVAFVRLEVDGHNLGAMLVSARGSGRFTDHHIALLDAIREPVALAMRNARQHTELKRLQERLSEDHQALRADVARAAGHTVVGADFGLRDVMDQIRKVARWDRPVLLLGETGTGKEVLAHALHTASQRSTGPMITLQCGAVPEALLDSELFGHERGAFTGAVARKRGRFERADGGTLFLDEIGELSLEAQVKLLRVLQERKFERVGGTETLSADVRIVAATHRDLEEMVKAGTFREDLWYRLAVLPIRIPPLRLRREDIPSLVRHFVGRLSRQMGLVGRPEVPARALDQLQAYDWPGNVRELQNIVERALILSGGGPLRFPALVARTEGSSATAPVTEPDVRFATLEEANRQHIQRALEHTDGQVAGAGGAAELLGLNASTLRARMRKLGVRGRPRSRGALTDRSAATSP